MPAIHRPSEAGLLQRLLERVDALERLIRYWDVDHYYIVSSYVTVAAASGGTATITFGCAFPEQPSPTFGAEVPPSGGVGNGGWVGEIESWVMAGGRYTGAVIYVASSSAAPLRVWYKIEGFVR